ncbi:hypothetical protein BC940DRAFT_293671 [Gongronella butleri]|nr:hypothetical protein BC940DRAFT_293671 [Gongronella butleri]
MVTESYEARQRLYDEITKRKRLEKLYYDPGSPRRSLLFRSPANRYSYLSSHELPVVTSSSAPTSPQQLRMDHEFGIYHDNLPSSATLGHHPFGAGAASPSRQSMLLAEHDRYKGWNIPAGYDDSDVQYNTSRMIDHQRLDQLHAQHHELQRQQMPTADQAYQAPQSPMSRRTSKSLPRPVPTMIPMPEPPDLSAIDPHALQPPMEIVSPALSDHINPLDSLSPPADALPSSSQHHHPIPGLSHTPISASSARSSSPHQTSDESTPLTSDHQ